MIKMWLCSQSEDSVTMHLTREYSKVAHRDLRGDVREVPRVFNQGVNSGGYP